MEDICCTRLLMDAGAVSPPGLRKRSASRSAIILPRMLSRGERGEKTKAVTGAFLYPCFLPAISQVIFPLFEMASCHVLPPSTLADNPRWDFIISVHTHRILSEKVDVLYCNYCGAGLIPEPVHSSQTSRRFLVRALLLPWSFRRSRND